MKLFVIVAVLVAAVAAEEQKIVGGDIAEPNSIPFMVSFRGHRVLSPSTNSWNKSRLISTRHGFRRISKR